jgi:hypothetical protein
MELTNAEPRSYTFGHNTYKAHCLAHLLFGSITDDLSIIIMGHIDQDFCNDGPLYYYGLSVTT